MGWKEADKQKNCLHKLGLDWFGEVSATVVLKRWSFGFADLAAFYDWKFSLNMFEF